jgi:hypothetical protein
VSFKILGLDWFEVVVQGVATIALGVALDGMLGGPASDAAIGFLIAGSLGVLAWRRRRAQLHAGLRPEDDYRVARLEDRLAQLELDQARVMELEERLDFTERMLVQQRERDAARLSSGGTEA